MACELLPVVVGKALRVRVVDGSAVCDSGAGRVEPPRNAMIKAVRRLRRPTDHRLQKVETLLAADQRAALKFGDALVTARRRSA